MSNPRVIPREQLSAWEKWELASLNEAEAEVAAELAEVVLEDAISLEEAEANLEAEAEQALESPAEVEEPATSDMPYPTAEEIEAISQQAQSEGFEAGLEAGRLVAEDEVNRLRAVLASVESTLQKAEAVLANEVLDLAVVIARQMVREELNDSPERLLPIVREALASMPAARSPSRVFLNPEDLTAISAMLGGEMPSDTWRFLADAHMQSGGCRIETPDSAVDLSLPVRWQNILRVLGRDGRPDLVWNAPEASTEIAPLDKVAEPTPLNLPDVEPELDGKVAPSPLESPDVEPELDKKVAPSSLESPDIEPELDKKVEPTLLESPDIEPELDKKVAPSPLESPDIELELDKKVEPTSLESPDVEPDVEPELDEGVTPPLNIAQAEPALSTDAEIEPTPVQDFEPTVEADKHD
ncbi:FliH/SctL family protein [Iodobacter sp.]|uniref:FliH/SctL family protein n=1 Tax=Iodobacter sp. TaxID=1915058 RepID=UPI0025E95FD2|nr:FliH/SctL family protein [Iodobacter sp.]